MTLSLVTDRHLQVHKYLRENKPQINHQFDISHIAKNLKKKLSILGKKKDCEIINAWIKPIINHFWRLCATCNGCFDILTKRRLSLLCHIPEKHQWQIENQQEH